MRSWVWLDLDPALFWDVTPREAAVIMQARHDRIEADRRHDRQLTYVGARLASYAHHNPRKMPGYERVFPEPRQAQSPEEIMAKLKSYTGALAARRAR